MSPHSAVAVIITPMLIMFAPALPLTDELQADWYNSRSVNANSRVQVELSDS
jgi:hypothetical protein